MVPWTIHAAAQRIALKLRIAFGSRKAGVTRAVAKRFNGNVAEKSEAPAPALAPLSSSRS